MSKQSAITQSTISSKPGTKSKTSLRGSYGKLTLDPTKFDFKSIVPSTTVASSSHYSPANAQSEKFVLMAHQTKSPRANNNPLGLSIENFDPKDTYTIDRKVHPQTTKASIRTSCAIPGTEKSKKASNPNEKSIPSKSKDAKAAIYNYEAFTQKKLAQGKEKDSKSKIMEEPPKKFSMPANIPSSVSSIYATGSNSHRAPLNSIPAEQINTNNRPFVYVPLNRRNSQKSNVDSESHQVQNYNSTSSQNKHLIPNNFFVDLASTSQEKHSPKASANHNAGINHHLSVPGDKVQSQKDSDLLRLVSDKNKEIYALSQDKAKLKSTLDMLSDEVQSIKKMRGALKDKEKLIENLQVSLTEAVKESQTLKKGLQKDSGNSYDENAHYDDPHDEHKRSRAHPSISDMDGVKALISQLKALTDGSEEHHDSLELKNSLLEAITKKNQSKPKKQEVSYALFSLENKPEKGSQHSEQGNSTIDLYQRNFSGTLDDALVKKINESPYYDSLRNGPKKTEKVSSGPKKNAFTQKKPDSQGGKQTATAGGNGTPRRTELEVHKKQGRGQTSASGMNMDILKRKFSHEPRMNSEGLTDLFIKKQSGEAGSTLAYTAEREPVGENMDMGKALGELKNRIAKLLNKHKDDHKKLISTYELYAQKLEKLSKG